MVLNHWERSLLNERVRMGLKAKGTLTRVGVLFNILQPLNLSRTEKSQVVNYGKRWRKGKAISTPIIES